MRERVRTLAALLLVCASAIARAATPIPEGEGRFEFVDAKGRPDRPIPVYTYRPAGCDAQCTMVIVMAGVDRNAADYRGYWKDSADRYKLVIVAPEFTKQAWPGAAAYNTGDIEAHPQDPSKWSFSAVEHLFDEVAEGRAGYVLFGHSAGGQFVQRMALFVPQARATMMVAANPGWYTMPVWRPGPNVHSYPYTLIGSPADEAQLKRALERPFTLMLGTRDANINDKSLNRSPAAQRQGLDRFSRGQAFFSTVRTAAEQTGAQLAWKLVEVPGVGHDGAAMSRAAADLLFGKAR